jgi:hypothetical protein
MFNLFPPPASQPFLRSCNGHAPLIIQEGRAHAGQNVQPCRDGQSSDLDSSKAQGRGGGSGRGSQSRLQSHSQALLFLNGFHGFPFILFSFLLLPLIIQERRARAGQNVQPRRDGQSANINSSIARGMWGKRERKSVCCTRKSVCRTVLPFPAVQGKERLDSEESVCCMPCTSISSRKALHKGFSGLIAHGIIRTRNRYIARILRFPFKVFFLTSLPP